MRGDDRRDGRRLQARRRAVAPAILWMDCRAAKEADRTARSRHPVLAYAGGGDAAEWLVPKAMWLAANEPVVYAESDIICECLDYVNFMLTGPLGQLAHERDLGVELLIRSPAASTTSFFAGIRRADLASKLPTDIFAVGSPIRPVTAAAAAISVL